MLCLKSSKAGIKFSWLFSTQNEHFAMHSFAIKCKLGETGMKYNPNAEL